MKKIIIIGLLLFSYIPTYATDVTFIFPNLGDIVGLSDNLENGLEDELYSTPLISNNDSRERFCLLKTGTYTDHINGQNTTDKSRIDFDLSGNQWELSSNKTYLAGITCDINAVIGSGTTNDYSELIYNEIITQTNHLSIMSNTIRFAIELMTYISITVLFFVTLKVTFTISRKLQFLYPWTNNR